MQKIADLKEILKNFYVKEGFERCGFISKGNSIVEVKNVCAKPDEGFDISTEDILLHTEQNGAMATWHTHPNQSSNLSGEDYIMFKAWPSLTHFIIGNDGVKAFKYDAGRKAVMEVGDESDL